MVQGKTGKKALSSNRTRDWLTKIALCSAGYGLFSDSVMIPMVNAIFVEFSNASAFLLNYVISGNAILALISGLVTGVLLRYIRRKPLLIGGTLVFAIGGIGGAFSTSLEFLAVMRSLDAISDGILTVTTAVMIVELWKSEKEQSFVFGMHSAFAGTFGCIVGIFAGYISVHSWRHVFYINGVTFISVILCILFVPDTKPPKYEHKEEGHLEEWEKRLVWKPLPFVGILGAMLVLGSLCYMIAMLLDLFIAEQGIGNSIITGYMSIITAAVGFIGNMSAPAVLTRIKRKSFLSLHSAVFGRSLLHFSPYVTVYGCWHLQMR